LAIWPTSEPTGPVAAATTTVSPAFGAPMDLGFDAAVDHRSGDLPAALAAACPDGIDVYFENVCRPRRRCRPCAPL
jgi:hypothetical protein